MILSTVRVTPSGLILPADFSLAVGRPSKLSVSPTFTQLALTLLLDLHGCVLQRWGTVAAKWTHLLPAGSSDAGSNTPAPPPLPAALPWSSQFDFQVSLVTSQVLLEFQLSSTESAPDEDHVCDGDDAPLESEAEPETDVPSGRGDGGEAEPLGGGGPGCHEVVREGVLVAWDRLSVECPCAATASVTSEPPAGGLCTARLLRWLLVGAKVHVIWQLSDSTIV